MFLSLTAVDDELAALSPAELTRPHGPALFSPLSLSLEQVDAMLAELGQGSASRAVERALGSPPSSSRPPASSPAPTAPPPRAEPRGGGRSLPPAARASAITSVQRPVSARPPERPSAAPESSTSQVLEPTAPEPLPSPRSLPPRRAKPLTSAEARASLAPTRRDLPPVRAGAALAKSDANVANANAVSEPASEELGAPADTTQVTARSEPDQPLPVVEPVSVAEPPADEPALAAAEPVAAESTPVVAVALHAPAPEPQAAEHTLNDASPRLVTSGELALSAESGSLLLSRDPDAEFDALLADATAPHGVPSNALLGTLATSDPEALVQGLDTTDEVVAAVVGERRPSQPGVTASSSPPSGPAAWRSPDASIDIPIDGESTEVFDDETIGAIKAASIAPPEELEISDLDMELDEEDTLQGAEAPKPPPLPPTRGSTPGENTQVDKRPSFLGRLFGKREE
jgi:hypothetical protein